MSLLAKLFGLGRKGDFRKVDWAAVNGQWRSIEDRQQTTNQAEMKQLLIQADGLVESVLRQAEVPGNTFGERLKSLRERMDKKDYRRLWQAHIKRNEIVHEPTSFVRDWEVREYLAGFKSSLVALRGLR